MKRNIVAVGMLLFFSATLWSCSESDSTKTPEQNQTLSESLQSKTVTISQAVDDIASSPGYGLITMSEGTKQGSSSDTRFSATITLDDIKGVYDYSPSMLNQPTSSKMWGQQVFERTDDSDFFVLRLPKEKAGNPWNLYIAQEGDSTLTNDFVITTSQYNYSFSAGEGFNFDYLLDAEIAKQDTVVGDLFVNWTIQDQMNFDYTSKFTFPNDYAIGIQFNYGDTIHYEYGLMSGDSTLFGEKIELMKASAQDSTAAGFAYELTIGNIQIKKSSDSDAYEVYRDGQLEADAVIEVLDDDSDSLESDIAFCREGRDIKITFSDGTSVILSELIGADTLEQLNVMFASMYDMYFVNHLVDKVAHEVYYSNMAAQ